MNPDRPIILVGCPRSGTTLLSVILHAHPRLAMPPETRFLIPAYRARATFGDLRQAGARRDLARWITRPKATRFRDLGLDRRAVIKEIVAGPPTLGSAAAIVWRAFARAHGKARWGEKRPAYWQDLDVILRLFPNAQIVHLVRDGRACVSSLKAVDWWEGGADAAMTSWVLSQHRIRRDTRQLPADAYHELRFEDLVSAPRQTLGDLCAFLGEEFDEAMLAHAQVAADIVPERKTWHARTGQDLDPARVAAWRTGLTPAEVGLMERVAGRRLTSLGYQLSGIGAPPGRGQVAAFYASLVRREVGIHKRRAQDAGQRGRERAELASQI